MTEKQYTPTEKERKLNQRKENKSSRMDVKSDKMTDVNVNLKEKQEEKTELETKDKFEKLKKKKQEIKPKEKAFVNGNSLNLSLKHCKWIFRMIKGKTPERAIEMLEEVAKGKRAVPMPTLEVGHQKGKGIAGGRFPKNASLEIIKQLKQVIANAVVSGVENPFIFIAKSDKASMPFRRNRRRAKRCHIYIEVRDKTKQSNKSRYSSRQHESSKSRYSSRQHESSKSRYSSRQHDKKK